jgi:CRP-like cAMP-binding protein
MANDQESTLDRLRRVPLFSELEERDLDRLAGLSRILQFRKKDMLFNEDDPYQGMFVILTGLAVVYKLSDEGRMLILHVCRPGDSVADVPLFDPDPHVRHAAHARVTRDSEVLFLPREGNSARS